MNCTTCNAENADGKRFCGDCGAVLSADSPQEVFKRRLHEELPRALKDVLKDRAVVEIDTSEKIAERLVGWAKLFGYVAGVPLVLLLVTLGLLGVKSYRDFTSKIDIEAARVEKKALDAATAADNAKTKGTEAEAALKAVAAEATLLQSKLASYRALEKQVSDVSQRVASVEQQVRGCGKERWSVKTGSDTDARLINLTQITATTVAEMRAWPRPAVIPSEGRAKPFEGQLWRVDGVLQSFKYELDSDYYLVIADEHGETIVAEIPAPACVASKSPFASNISAARAAFEERFSAVRSSTHAAGDRVRVVGVGFFDAVHGQRGMAPNGVELHPVINIDFNAK